MGAGGLSIYVIFLAAIVFAYPRQKWWIGAVLFVFAVGFAYIEASAAVAAAQ
ncbi:putative membrane protein YdbT with pleckstrin-like domain [Nitrobacter vulgaris]|uniref:hypothetical protein n=1 Tax=Nitrobacter vulgaris TaxID=29421 RepID=UPI00285AFC88|nr:hypothetical protein [Nitrobacter vulgaris]MDR6306191.1 putative membrane protein YdbT with pleckstrin-like domain [Nitrobacter vulgaris]